MSSQFVTSVLYLVDRSERLLGKFQRCSHTEASSVQWLFLLFTDVYRNASDNRNKPDRGDRRGTPDGTLAGTYVEPCITLLKTLEATLKASDQAGCASALKDLIEYASMMNLTLHLEATDSEQSSEKVAQYGDQLDKSCEWLYKHEVLKVDLSRDSTQTRSSIFVVKEVSGNSAQTALKVICPQAELPVISTVKRTSLNLNFICHCRDADHGNSLMYEAIDAWGIPTKTVPLSTDSNWSMSLYRSGEVVEVHLANVLLEGDSQLRLLSYRWAHLFSQLDGMIHRDDILRKHEGFTTFLHTRIPTAVPRSGVVGVKFVGSRIAGQSNVSRLSWVPEHLHFHHYTTAPDKLSTSVTDALNTPIFRDEDCFFIYLCRPPFKGGLANYVDAELFKIKVDRDTVIDEQCRRVALLNVDCIHQARVTTAQRCSEIEFEFSRDSESILFINEIKSIRRELLEMSLRGPLCGESVVHRSVFHNVSPASDPSSLVYVVVVYSPSAPRARYRIICTYNSGRSTICYELEYLSSGSKSKAWSIDDPPSRFVWVVGDSKSVVPSMNKMTWQEFAEHSTEHSAVDTRTKGRTYDSGSGPQVARESEISPERWFEDIELINLALRQSRRQASEDKEYRRVRIAVIDTGFKCDPEDRVRQQIAGYKDFTRAPKAHDGKGVADKAGLGSTDDPLDIMEDKKEHGTDSVQLILKVYKDAQLYIARIFEDNRVEGNMEQYLMADAIRWAVKHEVDIISISAGFQGYLNELWISVKAASAAGVLIFASAANWSFKAGAAVPARLPHVFGIFATDAGCKNVRDYNPPALERDPSFAFLGKDVVVTPGHEPIGGTSVSTAVAAGFVARLIDFTRQSDCRAVLSELPSAGDEFGMSKILQALTVKDGDYDCIIPLKIFGPGVVSSEPDKTAINRARVIEFLRRVLGELM